MKEIGRHEDYEGWSIALQDPVGIFWVIYTHAYVLDVKCAPGPIEQTLYGYFLPKWKSEDGSWFWIYPDNNFEEMRERAKTDPVLFIMTECIL